MAISYAFLGMLFLLDAALFGNYAIVRALRLFSNAQVEAEASSSATSERSVRRGDFGELSNTSKADPNGEYAPWEKARGFGMIFTAVFLGLITKEPSSSRPFPKWKIVWAGIFSTSAILMISTCILSPEAVLHLMGSDPTGDTSANFCVTKDFDDKIAQLKKDVYATTQVEVARLQYNHTVRFHQALVNDTTLYGSGNYICPDIVSDDGTTTLSGNKEDWLDHTVLPASVNGDFFPGYCGAALQAAIESARQTTCVDTICECPLIPQPFGSPIRSCLGGIARVCIDLPVACPKHTQDEETELQDYRREQLRLAEQQRQSEFSHMTFPVDLPTQLLRAAETTTQKILFQVDVASSCYVGYSILALVFPAPLVLFRPPLREFVRIYLFGVHKLTFILFVVCVWWGVEYFQMVFLSPNVRLYLRNLRDPCFLDGDYVFTRQQIVNDVCKDLVPMEAAWQRSIVTIQQVLVEATYFMNSCSCAFPLVDLGKFRTPEHITVAQADAIGFGTYISGLPYILTPKDDQAFVGDSTICTDSQLARSVVFEASDTDTNWWELWIVTGLMARILIKVAVCNFGIALYRMADPLSICAGRFEWPSERFKLGDETQHTLEKVKVEKATVHWLVAVKSAIFWGLLMHMCLINLVLTAWKSGGMTELHADEWFGLAAFGLALCSIPLGWFVSTQIDLRRLDLESATPEVEEAEIETPLSKHIPRPVSIAMYRRFGSV